MKAKLMPQSGNYNGNLLWRKAELAGKEDLRNQSIAAIKDLGYWASPFPEDDGVSFRLDAGTRTPDETLAEFQACFAWLEISLAASRNSNGELADLESEAQTPSMQRCTAIVPVLKLHFEESFDLGPFRLVCDEQFDPEPHERLAEWKGCYIQFEIELLYPDLLRMRGSVVDDDKVILECLAKADHALDLIRFEYCSFLRPEYTPNPAGQLESGFYSVELIPKGNTPLKPVSLQGISRPMSASNNWLGPQIEDRIFRGRPYLEEILHGRSDELAMAVSGALRFMRQAFYAHGDESKFLMLVFALDGLAHPKKALIGIDHHAYIAALVSHGKLERFKRDLLRYSELYGKVRNALVHKGKDFYELPYDAAQCCEDMLGFIKRLVLLIDERDLQTVSSLRMLAADWLQSPPFQSFLAEQRKSTNPC